MNRSMDRWLTLIWAFTITFGVGFLFYVNLVPMLKKPSVEEKAKAAVETALVEKITAELETTNKGDLLEVQREGSHIWVVVSPFRNNERHVTIVYQSLGSDRRTTSAHGLIAEGVVRVHRYGTPAWRVKALEYFHQ